MFFLKLLIKWLFRWAGNRALVGRCINRHRPEKGRFTKSDLDRILLRTLQSFEKSLPAAKLNRFETLGSRMNGMLGVASLAMYKALLNEGINRDYANELFTDVAWKVYEKFVVVPRLVARLITRNPQKQMNFMLHAFLKFPFNQPGYQWRVKSEDEGFRLDFYRCPVRDFFQQMGEEDLLLSSWCTLDFALAQVMVTGGHYERPHTLSAGDPVCDMIWSS